AYNTTRCYSTQCGGFVQTNITIAFEAAITRTSAFEGPQFDIMIPIWKNWWLRLGCNMVLVRMRRRSSMPKQYWHDTIVHMGSVKISEKDFRKAAYVCDI
ncbi:hypothetical protein IGI04_026520, partial [Brassica rapa subsp. trilocularis]